MEARVEARVEAKAEAEAEATGDAAGNSSVPPPTCAGLLHPVQRRECLRLYREFKSQHESGVCRVDTFSRLIRLKFPTEDTAHVNAMLAMVAGIEARAARAAEELEVVENDVNTIFEALDTDGDGTIDLEEVRRCEAVEMLSYGMSPPT